MRAAPFGFASAFGNGPACRSLASLSREGRRPVATQCAFVPQTGPFALTNESMQFLNPTQDLQYANGVECCGYCWAAVSSQKFIFDDSRARDCGANASTALPDVSAPTSSTVGTLKNQSSMIPPYANVSSAFSATNSSANATIDDPNVFSIYDGQALYESRQLIAETSADKASGTDRSSIWKSATRSPSRMHVVSSLQWQFRRFYLFNRMSSPSRQVIEL